ncbi:MAG: M3 family metallopeptidase [Candidatus Baltobacteraceae bacterium]
MSKLAAGLLGSLLLSMSPASATPLGPVRPTIVKWDLTPAEIAANCTTRIGMLDAAVKRIMAIKGPRTVQNTLIPLESAEADLNDKTVAEQFLFNMATDKAVRDASEKCGTDQSNYFSALGARPDLYAALAAVKKSGTAKTASDKKLLDLYMISFVRSGANLPADKRKEFVKLSGQLTDLGNKFAENLGNDKTTITITAAQAANLPADIVAPPAYAKQADGSYLVRTNESTATAFFNNQKDAAARKTFYLAYQNRAPANVAILEQAIGVRDRLAHLMGYQTWAAYVLADRMAQSPQRVMKFEEDLDAKLLPQARQDLAGLAALKAQDTGNPNATIDAWDISYYNNVLNKTKYSVDDEAIKQYFPLEVTVDRIMTLYHKLLGVTFVKVPHPNSWNAQDVISYNVFDTASGKFIGTTYFDFFPREGKFTHFANWPLIPARRLANGSYRPPVTAILGNWPRPAPGNPALLTHDDVITFFHEFGHNLAALLSTAPYETLSGGFRQDFVEAPSQMLENFMWQPSILKEVSSNVKTGAPLPDDLIQKMVNARYVDEAYFTVGQIKLGLVDQIYHSSGPVVDTTAVWAKVSHDYTPIDMPPGIHPQASFGHLFGYDAGYYSYLWALVYAQDMFTAFQKGGLENPAVGMRYRRTILEPARTLEPDVEVQAFLGRPMSQAAFYQQFTAPVVSTPITP